MVLGGAQISSVYIEWGLPTQFRATDNFLLQWADAQKLSYGKDAGWIVSSFLRI